MKQAGRNYKMGKGEIKIVCYANNAVIVSEVKNNLQKLSNKFGMQISIKKT